ncbi:MAG: glycosyltransferase family 2 protein [Actinobacteria bacterium]|nr:glycosyltransferase family 2 protein [Actinomycetota bacterium]
MSAAISTVDEQRAAHLHTSRMAEPLPSLSVVIGTVDRRRYLADCLESLLAEGYPELEIVVVDNGSTDGTGELLRERFPQVRMIRNGENRGFVGANNQGVEASSGELVLMLNDDTRLEPGALEHLVRALVDRPAWGACQAKLLLMDDPTRLDTAGSFLTATGFLLHRGVFAPDGPEFAGADEVFSAKGAALLVRRRVLEQVGLLDPLYFAYFEETDLCWRIWLGGWRVGFVGSARILHKTGGTAEALPFSFVHYHSFKNRIRTLAKNLGAPRLAWMLPYHVGLCLGVSLTYLVRRRPADALAIVRAIGWNVGEAPSTWQERRRVQHGRKVADADLDAFIMESVSMRTFFDYLLGRAGRA